MDDDFVKENYYKTLENISEAAKKSGRREEEVRLVVVTKGQSAEKIQRVISAGATFLGENYPEETNKKIAEMGTIPSSIEWHMIGHLQSRKIKFVLNHFSMIHSIDRMEIAAELNHRLVFPMRTLLEVNLSGETSKGGFEVWNEQIWPAFVDQIRELKEFANLNFCGLMTMPPYTNFSEDSRAIFKKCRLLCEYIQSQVGDVNFNQLSMGTSIDYQVAIEEGATYVRVGEAIMGPRNYAK